MGWPGEAGGEWPGQARTRVASPTTARALLARCRAASDIVRAFDYVVSLKLDKGLSIVATSNSW